MRVHHLNCGTMCPIGGMLVNGERGRRARLVCHCLLVETERHGLVLVDTGLGTRDVQDPTPRLHRVALGALRPTREPRETALHQLRALGHTPSDVRHVVLTHLDFDHAGGLGDFPTATVHVLAEERAAALHRRTMIDRARYRPDQWRADLRWQLYDGRGGERWFGFDAVRGLAGLPPEILIVPLAGPTRGHAAIAVRRSEDWLLHCGDAYFHRDEMAPLPRCPPLLRVFQRIIEVDREARLANQDRLRGLARDRRGAVTLFSSHDPAELAMFVGAAPRDVAPTLRVTPPPPRGPDVSG